MELAVMPAGATDDKEVTDGGTAVVLPTIQEMVVAEVVVQATKEVEVVEQGVMEVQLAVALHMLLPGFFRQVCIRVDTMATASLRISLLSPRPNPRQRSRQHSLRQSPRQRSHRHSPRHHNQLCQRCSGLIEPSRHVAVARSK